MAIVDSPVPFAPAVSGLSAARPPRLALWATGLVLLAFSVAGVVEPTPGQATLHNSLVVAAWALAVVVFSLSVLYLSEWRLPSLAALAAGLRAHWLEVVGVLALGLLALAFRGYALTTLPYSFIHDEGSMGIEAVNLLNGTRTDLFGVGWSSNPMWAFVPFALSIKFLGNTIVAVRLVSAIEGTLTVVMVYLMAREAFGRGVAAVAAGALLALPLHVHFSRLGVGNIVDGFLGALVFWLLWRAMRRGGLADYLWAGLATGLTMYVYLGSRLIVLLAALLVVYQIVRRPGYLRTHFAGLMAYTLAVVYAMAPMLAFFYQHPDHFYAKLNGEGIFQNGILAAEMAASGQSALHVILNRIVAVSAAFVAQPAPAGFFNSPEPYLGLLASVFFVLGMAHALTRLAEPPYALVLVWFWTVVIIGGALTGGIPPSQRLVQSVPAVAIFIGLGLVRTLEAVARRGYASPRLSAALGALVVAAITAQGAYFYFNTYPAGHYFEDASNEAALLVNEQAARLGPDYRLYLLGEPRVRVTFPNFSYLTPEVAKQDYNLVTAETLAALPSDNKGAFFAALPERRGDLELVAQLLPGGQWQEVRRRRIDEPSYYAYILAPNQFRERAGLAAAQ
jgi:4-amino-4-deoxy-L-arabinose transferase-like glycosyltransferase